jgi:hypothetical protein
MKTVLCPLCAKRVLLHKDALTFHRDRYNYQCGGSYCLLEKLRSVRKTLTKRLPFEVRFPSLAAIAADHRTIASLYLNGEVRRDGGAAPVS